MIRVRLILGSASGMMWGFYAAWLRLHRRLAHGVSRFVATAEEMDMPEVGDWFLNAARMQEADAWQRFAAAPPSAHRTRDMLLAVRQGSGEDVNGLQVTRDVLHFACWFTPSEEPLASLPGWVGVTGDQGAVQGQFGAAAKMLERLRVAGNGLIT